MNYTGAVESYSYNDCITGELITIYFIDIFNTRSALPYHSNVSSTKRCVIQKHPIGADMQGGKWA